MKNLRQFIIFQDCIVKRYPTTLSISLLSSNLYSVYLSSGILHNIVNSFSIPLSTLEYERFLVIGFINKLVRNLLILRLVVSEFAK